MQDDQIELDVLLFIKFIDIYLVSCIGTFPQCIEKECIARHFLRIYQEENQLKKIETPPCHLFQHQCKPFLCSALSLWRPNYLICAPRDLIKIEWFVGVGFTRSLALLFYYSSYYIHFISKTLKYFFFRKCTYPIKFVTLDLIPLKGD